MKEKINIKEDISYLKGKRDEQLKVLNDSINSGANIIKIRTNFENLIIIQKQYKMAETAGIIYNLAKTLKFANNY